MSCVCSENAIVLLPVLLIAGSFIAFMIWDAVQTANGSNQPVPFVVSVENGTLHTLDFDYGTSTVIYNLSAVFRFRNPSNYGTARVSWLAEEPSYGGQKLGPDTNLPSFKLRRKKTTMVPLDVQGRQIVDARLAATVGRTYAEDAGRGYYIIEAKIKMKTGGLRCDSSCTLYFPAPAAPRGVINLFDGEECTTEYKIF